MIQPEAEFPRDQVRPLRGGRLIKQLHRVLPLGRYYYPLVALLNRRQGMVTVPFDGFQLLQPAGWHKQLASYVLTGTNIIPESDLLLPICRELKRGCLIDAGANVGLYTFRMRSVSSLPIIAYEPQPFLFKLIQWNVVFNRLPDVDARNVACGAERGELPFALGINGAVVGEKESAVSSSGGDVNSTVNWEQEAELTGHGGAVVKVPVRTLDEDLADKPAVALLKIDCEGFEHHILLGAQETLNRHRPYLFLEIHPSLLRTFGRKVEQITELLSPRYDLEFWRFDTGSAKSKLARSLAKFRRPHGHRYANTSVMLAAVHGTSPPSQIYCIGRPTS